METEVEHNVFTQGKSHWLPLHRKCHQLLNNNRQSGLHLLPHQKNRLITFSITLLIYSVVFVVFSAYEMSITFEI